MRSVNEHCIALCRRWVLTGVLSVSVFASAQTATLDFFGGFSGSGQLQRADGSPAEQGSLISIVTFGDLIDTNVAMEAMMSGTALSSYSDMIDTNFFDEVTTFMVDPNLGGDGVFSKTVDIMPRTNAAPFFMFAFNSSDPDTATEGGIFSNDNSDGDANDDWFLPRTNGMFSSFDAGDASEAFFGDLIDTNIGPSSFGLTPFGPAGSGGVHLRMAALPSPFSFTNLISQRFPNIPTGQRGTRDDPDGDNVANVLEVLLGHNPDQGNLGDGRLPTGSVVPNNGASDFLLSFTVDPELAASINWQIDRSVNLRGQNAWSAFGAGNSFRNQGLVTIRIAVDPSTNPLSFFRVRINDP